MIESYKLRYIKAYIQCPTFANLLAWLVVVVRHHYRLPWYLEQVVEPCHSPPAFHATKSRHAVRAKMNPWTCQKISQLEHISLKTSTLLWDTPAVKSSAVFVLAISMTLSASKSFGLMMLSWRESLIATWCTNMFLSLEAEAIEWTSLSSVQCLLLTKHWFVYINNYIKFLRRYTSVSIYLPCLLHCHDSQLIITVSILSSSNQWDLLWLLVTMGFHLITASGTSHYCVDTLLESSIKW